MGQPILHTIKRYQTLFSNRIKTLPIAILMPHSACNCRCVMCDIWKGNKNAKQLNIEDVTGILVSLKKLNTKRIVMSGGEALLNKNFFTFCEIIQSQNIKITLLSTGLTLFHHAEKIVTVVDEIIVSLDGDEKTHNEIRNIPNAYSELKRGVQKIKALNPKYPISCRTVIHRLNYKIWDELILAAKEIGLDKISFLPADVTSEAFNRIDPWEKEKQESVLIPKEELPVFLSVLNELINTHQQDFKSGFIVESEEKLRKLVQYYSAHYGLVDFPSKKCNAPWVSAVIEADGNVRPCFFHDVFGSIKHNSLEEILNSEASIAYRSKLNVMENPTCVKCVCYLNLKPSNAHY